MDLFDYVMQTPANTNPAVLSSEISKAVEESQVQVDYAQNDPNAKDYIKNRPFYEKKGTRLRNTYEDWAAAGGDDGSGAKPILSFIINDEIYKNIAPTVYNGGYTKVYNIPSHEQPKYQVIAYVQNRRIICTLVGQSKEVENWSIYPPEETEEVHYLDSKYLDPGILARIEKLEDGSVVVDATLTQDGQAADAAAVGDRLSALSDEKANQADVDKLKGDVAAITPDDTTVDGKPWTSKKIVDSLCQPFEESGNPVQCYPVENYPLGVKVSWEPAQEGSGTPSPDNIRPITGRDAVSVTRCGENLLKPPGINKNYNGIVFTANDDGTVTINGTSTRTAYYDYFDVENPLQLAEGDYVLISGSSLTRISVSDTITDTIYASAVGENKIHHIHAGNYIVFIAVDTGITADNVIARPQIVLGTTATPYEPYTGSTTDIALPETVYGGEVDAVSGEGQETWKTLTLDGTTNAFTQNGEFWNLPRNSSPGIIDGSNTDCSHFPNASFSGNQRFGLLFTSAKRMSKYFQDISALNAYLAAQYAAGTPVQVCYKLEEPVPFTATGAQPIPALSGVNTIYTDVDGVVVTGAEDPKHTITELKNAIISLGGNV